MFQTIFWDGLKTATSCSVLNSSHFLHFALFYSLFPCIISCVSSHSLPSSYDSTSLPSRPSSSSCVLLCLPFVPSPPHSFIAFLSSLHLTETGSSSKSPKARSSTIVHSAKLGRKRRKTARWASETVNVSLLSWRTKDKNIKRQTDIKMTRDDTEVMRGGVGRDLNRDAKRAMEVKTPREGDKTQAFTSYISQGAYSSPSTHTYGHSHNSSRMSSMIKISPGPEDILPALAEWNMLSSLGRKLQLLEDHHSALGSSVKTLRVWQRAPMCVAAAVCKLIHAYLSVFMSLLL